jgi:ATP-grasp domain, R2K clade family 3
MVTMMPDIFVFGSNLAGRHGAGSAKEARLKHGAIYGQGRFKQGNSYAIPTIDRQFFEQEVVEFQQEYRVYILRGLIVGCGRYDDLDLPDVEQAELNSLACNIMAAWKDAPVAYAIDLGIIKDRGLSLVEITDAWAIGWYKPFDRKLYAEMLKARWDEIVGNK